jgi:hypothetical protein
MWSNVIDNHQSKRHNRFMKSLWSVAVIFAGLAVFAATPDIAVAGWKKIKPPPKAEADTSDRITALHVGSITVTLYSTHASKEYKVTPATKITVNGAPAAFSSLSTAMTVVVTAEADGRTAATIDAKSPAPPGVKP